MKTRQYLSALTLAEMNTKLATPKTVSKETSLFELLKKSIEKESHNLYVIDDNQQLVGVIRGNTLIEHLFPLTSFAVNPTKPSIIPTTAHTAEDIMIPIKPATKKSTLQSIAKTFLSEKTSELPIVNEDMTLEGNITISEIVSTYLTIKEK